MSYKITKEYCWYIDKDNIVKMYLINGIPFTFDELPKIAQEDPEIIKTVNTLYTPDQMFHYSFYLIDEECHPCLFDLDLENPEVLDEIL